MIQDRYDPEGEEGRYTVIKSEIGEEHTVAVRKPYETLHGDCVEIYLDGEIAYLSYEDADEIVRAIVGITGSKVAGDDAWVRDMLSQ